MRNLSYDAMIFAMECHKDQKRKYTNVPYFTHLAEVVGLLSTSYMEEKVLSIGWLHDVMEDCGVSYEILYNKFGEFIADGVKELSDLEQGNRSERKLLSRIRLANAECWVQDIKVCDIISNTSSIIEHDPKFAKVYIEEAKLLLDGLIKDDKLLLNIAIKQIDEYHKL